MHICWLSSAKQESTSYRYNTSFSVPAQSIEPSRYAAACFELSHSGQPAVLLCTTSDEVHYSCINSRACNKPADEIEQRYVPVSLCSHSVKVPISLSSVEDLNSFYS